jgi:KpsF/GutQ family protein
MVEMGILSRDIIEVITREGNTVLRVAGSIGTAHEAAVQQIISATLAGGNIFLSGIGKCSFIADKLAATYCSLGIPSFYLNCAHSLHGDIGAVRSGDVVLLFSKSGNTNEMLDLASELLKFKIFTVSLTCNIHSKLANLCDINLYIPAEEEADHLGIAPTASTTAMMALGDAIGVTVSKYLEFNRTDFARFHPKGSLGEVLK